MGCELMLACGLIIHLSWLYFDFQIAASMPLSRAWLRRSLAGSLSDTKVQEAGRRFIQPSAKFSSVRVGSRSFVGVVSCMTTPVEASVSSSTTALSARALKHGFLEHGF